jgi:hypothetical protein
MPKCINAPVALAQNFSSFWSTGRDDARCVVGCVESAKQPSCSRTKNINFIGQTLDALVTTVLFHGTYPAATLLLNLADHRKERRRRWGSSKFR